MSRSKVEIDNFIISFRRKAKSEQEIQLRGFQFATFYWEAREYVLGIKWAQSYLAVKHNDNRAHKVLGNLYEGVKDYGKAIDCYKKSLELNDTQRELILRIASLGCTIPNYDVEKLRYWVERAERFYPTHINVHKIKENIFRRSGKLPDYEIYLRNKLAQSKGDYYLNCKLVKLLIEMERLREAVDHILLTQDLESVADQPIWWESTVHTLEIYIKSIRQGEEKTAGEETIMEMHSHLLMALCKWIMLSLAMMDKPPHNAVVLLKGLDQCLLRANSLKMNSNWDYVLNEMASQLYYLMGLHLCRMAAMIIIASC
ncbi:RANBP2-like and GRIP domain-containing protein 5/6 [Anneissia japonica]|uniref:RANBP2-like and GRIP domain-containing protein 5/6 n=1 Tax=Anneissia japonica TaxID=1529436 RepID=UPI001425BB6A|nr:RANBP2-like and GRIP domain-containing protein 5/6 [Anneissia japonica]